MRSRLERVSAWIPRTLRLGWLLGLLIVGTVHAEKVDSTPEELRNVATHVVRGRVRSIAARREWDGGWERVLHRAIVEIHAVEKGTDLPPGSELEVRYWSRAWILPGVPPTDTTGHAPLPRSGDEVLVHLVHDGYNGFGQTTDGGYDVVGRNGWQILVPSERGTRPSDPYDELEADWRRTAGIGGFLLICLMGIAILRFVRRRK